MGLIHSRQDARRVPPSLDELRELFDSAGLSQGELGRRADLAQPTVSLTLAGRRQLAPATANRLRSILEREIAMQERERVALRVGKIVLKLAGADGLERETASR